MGVTRPDEPPRKLAALDPAKRRCGIALFVGGQLVTAKTLRNGNPLRLAQDVILFVDRVHRLGGVRWVAEFPVVYQKQRANEPHLRGLVRLVERVEARVGWVQRVEPFDWKGNISKKATERRVKKRLEAAELDAMIDQSEDTFDAIGIGLWYCRRANQGVTEP